MVKKTTGQVELDRISVSLIPKVSEELDAMQTSTGLSKTDIVNRAISLYAFIALQLELGQDIVLRDQKSGELQLVHLV